MKFVIIFLTVAALVQVNSEQQQQTNFDQFKINLPELYAIEKDFLNSVFRVLGQAGEIIVKQPRALTRQLQEQAEFTIQRIFSQVNRTFYFIQESADEAKLIIKNDVDRAYKTIENIGNTVKKVNDCAFQPNNIRNDIESIGTEAYECIVNKVNDTKRTFNDLKNNLPNIKDVNLNVSEEVEACNNIPAGILDINGLKNRATCYSNIPNVIGNRLVDFVNQIDYTVKNAAELLNSFGYYFNCGKVAASKIANSITEANNAVADCLKNQ